MCFIRVDCVIQVGLALESVVDVDISHPSAVEMCDVDVVICTIVDELSGTVVF